MTGKWMRAVFDDYPGTKPVASVVRRCLQSERGLLVVINPCAKPAEKRPDVRCVRVLAVNLEIFLFVRNPNTPSEFMLIIVNRNFDHSTHKKVSSFDDAKVFSQERIGVVRQIFRPRLRSIKANMRQVVMCFTTVRADEPAHCEITPPLVSRRNSSRDKNLRGFVANSSFLPFFTLCLHSRPFLHFESLIVDYFDEHSVG